MNLAVRPVDQWRSSSTRWSDHLDDDPANLQYKYVEQVVHDVKDMNSGEESAMVMK